MPINTDLFVKIKKMTNLFENDNGSPETDYKTIYLYNDGPNKIKQVTLSSGYTQFGGNLWKVIQRYIDKKGSLSKFFIPYEDKMKDGSLYEDSEFLSNLIKAGDEQVMKDAQDEIFQQVYLQPALDWAAKYGFKQNLSIAAIADSYLHSGKMTPFLMNSFSEKKPSAGGDEKKWITAYLQKRLEWFEGSPGLLHTCVFRPQFFLDQIAKNNWSFNCPLVVKTKGKIC